MKILIDTNIIMDYLINREPYSHNAFEIFRRISKKEIQGYMAAHSVTNLFYILRNAYDVDKRKQLLLDISDLLTIVSVSENKIISALNNSDFNDLEDCIQMECAIDIKADYIVTRNPKDFRYSVIKIISPEDLLKI